VEQAARATALVPVEDFLHFLEALEARPLLRRKRGAKANRRLLHVWRRRGGSTAAAARVTRAACRANRAAWTGARAAEGRNEVRFENRALQ
jgi:hypothetical protein